MIKEKLARYRDIQRELRQLEERIIELEQQLTCIPSQSYDSLQTRSGNADKLGNAICKITELKGMYWERYTDMTKEAIEIEGIIASLEPNERLLMRKRYLEGKRWEDICSEMNYSWRGIHKIHAKVLSRLEMSA